MSTPNETRRELTIDERMTFGECSVCGAKHGQRCRSEVGLRIGHPAGGDWSKVEGAHLARLNDAPRYEVKSYV